MRMLREWAMENLLSPFLHRKAKGAKVPDVKQNSERYYLPAYKLA